MTALKNTDDHFTFFCIETDWLSRAQVVNTCAYISEEFGIAPEQITIFCKPNRSFVKSVSKSHLIRYFTRLFIIIKKILKFEFVESLYMRFQTYLAKRNTLSQNIFPTVRVEKANSDTFLNFLKLHKSVYVFFIHFDEIIKEEILSSCLPINIHSGFLPEFRGCHPLHWQILDNKTVSCLTIHKMTKGLDEGNIIVEVPFDLKTTKSSTWHMFYNYRHNVLKNSLIIAIRRILFFDRDFGINQDHYKGESNYYTRP